MFEYDEGERDLLTLQESWADFARALRTGIAARRTASNQITFHDGANQISAHLDVHRQEFEAGDKGALIDALRIACRENVPLPYWAADGILSALAELDANPAATLHSVMGMEKRYPTSRKRAMKARDDWKTKQLLYTRVSALMTWENMNQGDAIKKVIADLPIQSRIAHKWFKEMNERQQKHLRARRGIKLHKLR